MDDLAIKTWGFYLQLGQTVFCAVVGVYAWIVTRHKANAKSIDALKEDSANKLTTLEKGLKGEMNAIDNQLIKVQSEVNHLPDHKDIANVHRRIDELAQVTVKVEGQTKQINTNVKLLTEHLLNKQR